MLEPTEHHRDERMVAGPIPISFSYPYIAGCNKVEISFVQVRGVEGIEPTMALPYLLSPACQEETCGRASRRLSRAGLSESHPDAMPLARYVFLHFPIIPIMYAYANTLPHAGGIPSTQEGGRRALSWPCIRLELI